MQQAIEKNPKEIKPVKMYQIWLPVLLGIAVVTVFFFKEFDVSALSAIQFSTEKILFLFFALLFIIVLRDGSLMWRFRILADNLISWRQAFNVHILSEFTSAITPSAVGGSSLVVLFLAKEGINAGRGTTIMLINLLLDELFFIFVCPLLFLMIPPYEMFPPSSHLFPTLGYVFAGLYLLLLMWTLLLFVGIFFRPDLIKNILLGIFKLPFLKRWQENVNVMTDNLIHTSRDVKNRSFVFWIKLFLITILIWVSRFFIVNIIFAVFVPVNDHLIVFARQVILWILMIVMPTPGGSGMSEFTFKEYYSDIFLSGSIVLLVIVIWRFVSFYLYLLLGTMILPQWLRKTLPTLRI